MEKWVTFGFTAVSAIVAVAVYVSHTKFKADQLAKEGQDTKNRLDEAIKDLRGVTIQLATISREQAIINLKVAEALAAVMSRVEKLTERQEYLAREIAILKDRADG